jgi:methyl-accepting chemotaxis protein PixJ
MATRVQQGNSSGGKPSTFWQNLSFRWKLALLLIVGAGIPVIAVTQGIVWFSQQNAQRALQESLKSTTKAWVDEYILYGADESDWQVDTISRTVEAAQINLQDPNQVERNRSLLQALVSQTVQDKARPDTFKSFRAITDAQGRTVAQYSQILKDYPLGATPPEAQDALQPVFLNAGINLGNMPIVRNSIQDQRALKGVELLDGQFMQRLGLAKQATVTPQPQETQRLTPAEQPAPQGTYPMVDQGKAGLVTLSVRPIKVQGRLVGTAISGTLLNRSHSIVDVFAESYGAATSIYAEDLLVATTVPNANGKARAIGMRAPQQAAEVVLGQGKEFFSEANISGKPSLAGYAPLYDHQAKPVGIAFVAIPPAIQEANVGRLQQIGYLWGIVSLALAGLLALLFAETFSRPVRRLTAFVKQVGSGSSVIPLEVGDRRDEIGVLSQGLNEMAAEIQASLNAVSQEVAREQFLQTITQQVSQYPQSDTALESALVALQQALSTDRLLVYRFNEETWQGTLLTQAVANAELGRSGNLLDVPYLDPEALAAYRQDQIQVRANLHNAGLDSFDRQRLESLAVQSDLVVPILRGSRRVLSGLLVAQQCVAPRDWQPGDVDLLKQTATQIGLAFDRGNLLQQTRRAVERAQTLRDITLHLAQSLKSEDVFNTAVSEIRQALQCDRVIVYRFDATWKGTIVAESVSDGFPRALGAEINDPCFANQFVEKYKRGRVQATPDITKAGLTECHLQQLRPFAVKANLVAPILVGGNLLGLLIAHHCASTRNWQSAETDLFTQLATQVGLSLERTLLLEQSTQLADEQRRQRESIQMQLIELLGSVDGAARGDLTVRANVTAGDIGTVADFFNNIIESLRQIVTQVKQSATQVTASLGENESAIRRLAEEALRQTSEITQTLDSVQQMSRSIQQVAENAQQAADVAHQASTTAEAGGAAMDRTVTAIQMMRRTVTDTAKKVQRLGESSQQISRVVSLINQLALETNMLAINAGIEAARAGEEGRGFAVVAQEVGNLAAQSASATKEIEQIVAAIQRETGEVVTAIEQGTSQIAEGAQLVEDTKQSLGQMLGVSREIDKLVQAISTATISQAETSQAVTTLMKEIAQVSERTSDSSRQVSTALKQTVEVAQQLQASVGTFNVGAETDGGKPRTST